MDMHFSVKLGYLNFENSSAHKKAYLKTVNITYRGKVSYYLLLNEVNFKNKPTVGNFDQAQVDTALGFKLNKNFLWKVGFHYLPYAKPQITDKAYGFFTSFLKKGKSEIFGLDIFQNNLREGLSTLQISPKVGKKIKKVLLISKLDIHYYNKRITPTVKLPSRSLLSMSIGLKYPLTPKTELKTSLWFGRRIFSYQNGLVENHPQEQRYGFALFLKRLITRKIASEGGIIFKSYKEIKTGKKAKVYGILLGFSF